MAVLTNELRNLLTEESLDSIMTAGSAPNGHLVPKFNGIENNEHIKEPINNDIQINSQEKEVFPEVENNVSELKSHLDRNLEKHEKNVQMLTSKMNEIIKTLNMLEKKVSFLESKPAVKAEQAENPQQTLEDKKEVKEEEKKNIHPRSMASLPPELSIDKVFSCNGKTFN